MHLLLTSSFNIREEDLFTIHVGMIISEFEFDVILYDQKLKLRRFN